MPIPTEITFHQIEHSDGLEQTVHRWVARLEHMYERIVACAVVIGLPHRRHRHGGHFQVSLRLEVPGGALVANHLTHEDPYVAVADAFRAARRQLQDHVAMQRGFVKHHTLPHQAASSAAKV